MNAGAAESRWIVGIAVLLGALGALAVMPHARSAAAAQVELAVGRRPDWIRAACGGSSARLKKAMEGDPDDSALQVGGATMLPSGPDPADANDGSASTWKPDNDAVLKRLQVLADRFPADPAIRAHQLRYLIQQAVTIRRHEEDEVIGSQFPGLPPATGATSGRPAPAALRAFATAAAAGGELEPNNGYFDAMMAVGEFAGGQDPQALRHVHTAAGKSHWDDHAIDESTAQWKLLQAAYGDRGALQKLPGIRHLLLGHFGRILTAGRIAVWHAAQRERAGDLATAFAVRHDVMQLGMTMAEARPGVIGKWISLELVNAGNTVVPAGPLPSAAAPMAAERFQRLEQERRERYERFLRAHGLSGEADWVHAELARAEAVRVRLGQLDGSEKVYPPWLLVVWWVFDLMLLRQAAGLMLLWCAAWVLGRARVPVTDESHARATLKWIVASLAVLLTPVAMGVAIGSVRVTGGGVDGGPVLRLLASMLVLWSGSVLLARVSGREGFARSVKVLKWLSASLGLLTLPFVLVAIAGPDAGLWGTLGVGTVMAGTLGLARRARRRDQRAEPERPLRWQPGLLALICVLLSSLMLFASCVTWGTDQWDSGLGMVLEWSIPALILALVPALLLTFAALCRVAALDLPLRAGLARVVRQMAPYAIGLLLFVYIAALIPTLAGDRASQRTLDQELSSRGWES